MLPAKLLWLAVTKMIESASTACTTYVLLFVPMLMSPDAVRLTHWKAKGGEALLPVTLAVSVCPACAVPLMVTVPVSAGGALVVVGWKTYDSVAVLPSPEIARVAAFPLMVALPVRPPVKVKFAFAVSVTLAVYLVLAWNGLWGGSHDTALTVKWSEPRAVAFGAWPVTGAVTVTAASAIIPITVAVGALVTLPE